MFKFLAGVAAGAVIAIANISTAVASPTAAAMREGGYALAPFSFVKFCVDYPDDCPKSGGAGRIKLTSGRMAELASVNRAVNNGIRPKADTSALRYWWRASRWLRQAPAASWKSSTTASRGY